MLLYLAFTLRHLYLLDQALDGHRRVPLFETRGLWAEIFARVDKLRTKARNRKKKYHRLLREVRESTGALSDGGIILNADHEIMWFNPAAARLLGLNHATDVGHRIDNLLRHPDFVAYLERTERRWHQRRVAAPRNRLAARADHPVRHGSTAGDHSRRDEREERRTHASRLRRKRFARAALASDGDQRLHRRAERGG